MLGGRDKEEHIAMNTQRRGGLQDTGKLIRAVRKVTMNGKEYKGRSLKQFRTITQEVNTEVNSKPNTGNVECWLSAK